MEIFTQPNKYAKQSVVHKQVGQLKKSIVGGYQNFTLDCAGIALFGEVSKKESIMGLSSAVKGKTVLDLGCNSGALSFNSFFSGAEGVVGIDMDKDCCDFIKQACIDFKIDKFQIFNTNVQNVDEVAPGKFDIVIAMALVHWLYSCTASFGSLDSVIELLSSKTTGTCFVEWVGPDDAAIKSFKHINFNTEIHKDAYVLENFLAAGHKHFKNFEFLGDVRNTRSIYCGSNM